MSQLAQLSEAEIEERFHITSRTAITFTLQAFIKSREPFTLQFGDGQQSFMTALLAVDTSKQRLVFDCSGSALTNQQILGSEHNTFLGHPGGIPVQFAAGRVVEVSHEGGKAFAVPLPDRLIRLQRREHFRIEISRGKPLMFSGRLQGGELLKAPAHDISVSGLGLDVEHLPANLDIEQQLSNCRFMLPGETREFFFTATIRRIVELQRPNGAHYWRIGLEFDNLTPGDETRIQRYIAHLERERRELS